MYMGRYLKDTIENLRLWCILKENQFENTKMMFQIIDMRRRSLVLHRYMWTY